MTKKEYKKKLSEMSNQDLWYEYVDNQQPDDYDGCFTKIGQMMAETSEEEIVDRLIKIGFLTPKD